MDIRSYYISGRIISLNKQITTNTILACHLIYLSSEELKKESTSIENFLTFDDESIISFDDSTLILF